jgi:hypothetical protein
MNRQKRRAAKFSRRQASEPETIRTLDRTELLRLAAAIVAAPEGISGVTVITPDGEISYIDGTTLRRGGGRA